MIKSRIYVASKTFHAPKWLLLKNKGLNIISTWIYEAKANETRSYNELAHRCIDEVIRSDILLLYCEPGDNLKGALIEVGAALAHNKPVYAIGSCDSISKVFKEHTLWYEYRSTKSTHNPDDILKALSFLG